MEKDKISVIVLVYNAGRTVERCISSITGGGSEYRNNCC